MYKLILTLTPLARRRAGRRRLRLLAKVCHALRVKVKGLTPNPNLNPTRTYLLVASYRTG